MVYQYHPRSADAWDKRANQQGGDFEGYILDTFKTWTPKKGDNAVRILPPTHTEPDGTPAKHYGIDIHVHYSVGPVKASVLCLQQMKAERCPICEARARALKLGEEEEARQLKASKRVLVWMLDQNDKDRGPMLWSMPYTLDRDFSALAKDKQSGEIFALDHPDDGYDIFFDRTGEGIQVQYGGKQLARRPSPVPDSALEYIEERPLPGCLLWRTYAEVKRLYEGGAGEDPHPAVPPRDNPPRNGGAAEPVPIRRRGDEEPPKRRVQAVVDEAEPAPAAVSRRRVAPAEEPARTRREEINQEVPWETEGASPATTAAERLTSRYRRDS